jgi:homoserine dehydrogenase
MFFGRGAGSGPTASAVVADILNIAALLKVGRGDAKDANGKPLLDPLLACSPQLSSQIAPIEDTQTRFYVRLLTRDEPGVIGQVGTCFGNHGVSLESIVQTEVTADRAEIVVVSHEVREGDFRKALVEIEALRAIDQVASLLRVL